MHLLLHPWPQVSFFRQISWLKSDTVLSSMLACWAHSSMCFWALDVPLRKSRNLSNPQSQASSGVSSKFFGRMVFPLSSLLPHFFRFSLNIWRTALAPLSSFYCVEVISTRSLSGNTWSGGFGPVMGWGWHGQAPKHIHNCFFFFFTVYSCQVDVKNVTQHVEIKVVLKVSARCACNCVIQKQRNFS